MRGKRQRIGIEVGNITSTGLTTNILRDWDEWASRTVNMDTHCVGQSRPMSNRYMGPEEMYYYNVAINPGLNKEQYLNEVYPTETEQNKIEAYNDSVAKLLTSHFLSFHYHPYDKTKKTYRFFRDQQNDGEYNTTIKLINTAQWLWAFHLENKSLNRRIKNCLDEKADELDAELSTASTDDASSEGQERALF